MHLEVDTRSTPYKVTSTAATTAASTQENRDRSLGSLAAGGTRTAVSAGSLSVPIDVTTTSAPGLDDIPGRGRRVDADGRAGHPGQHGKNR
ncbi:hypothetical protein ACFZAR_36820 [Streptomyces sp. NPDC008222]|uniref:hypothetical protein n=1 Tax=Streptomyces sp. NPDC008222 TaxID=3364820 RepID=UPI0036E7839D